MNFRQTTLQISKDAIIHNLKAIKYRSEKEVIAVIKANGYGIGALFLANTLIPENIAMLAVSSLDEAIFLRKNNIKKDILVLGYTSPKFLTTAIKNNLILTAPSLDWVKKISSIDPINLRVHLKCDTKMNRMGITTLEDWQTAIVLLRKLKVKVEGAYTHYAYSDQDEQTITAQQYQQFSQFIKQSNYTFKWIHCANSDAAIKFKGDKISNAVRVGIALLGYAKYNEDLLPSLALYTTVTHLSYPSELATVSYGCSYTTKANETIATIPIGYADGFIRQNQGRKVYLNDLYVEIVGRICMDQCMLSVADTTQIEDEVEIFGPHIPLEKIASDLNTIAYEVITLLSERITRVYTYKGKVINQITKK